MVGLAPNGPNPQQKGRFHSGPIVFKVQGVLHRVPRYGFEKLSTEYTTLFPINDPEGIGKDDDHPILLEDVEEAEFEGFLDVLYPTSLFDPVELSATQWMGALSLATRWSMPRVREVAVEKISKDPTLTPLEKLAIAQKYNVSVWIIEECEAIAKDFHQIKSIEELSSQIGWEGAARIAWAAAQRPDQEEADRSGPHDVRPPTSLIVTENEPAPTRRICAADIIGFGQDGVYILRNGFQSSPKLVIHDFGYNAGVWRVDKHVRLVGPTTVRGLRDIIGFGDAGVLVSRNLGNNTFGPNNLVVNDFGYAQGWRVGQHVRYVSDLRKTGLVDIIGFGHSGVMVSLNNGDGTFGPTRLVLPNYRVVSGWKPDQHLRFLADVTGNGLPDIVGFGGSNVSVALNRGDGTFDEGKAVVNDLAYNNGGWRVDNPRTVADMTGDGKADIVGFGHEGVHIALNAGNGTFHPPKLVISDFGYGAGGWRVDKHPRFVADVTGNGVGDIVGFGDAGVYVAINNGDGTFQAPKLVVKDFGYMAGGWRVEKHRRFVVDLNGDGAADIIGFGDGAVLVSYNDGKGNFGPVQTLTNALAFNSGQWSPDKTVRWVTNLDL